MRLFTGLPVSEEIINAIGAFKYRNQFADRGFRWVSPDNLHITSAFLGEVPKEKVSELSDAIQTIVENYNAFELQFKKVDFSPGRKPGMIWAWFYKSRAFTELTLDLKHALDIDTEKRKKPLPHITLARFKKPVSKSEIDFRFRLSNHFLKVQEVFLWQSIPKSDGMNYKVLKQFSLKQRKWS